ncbi:MAG: hypothetical protein ABI678_12245 [Kofleriaceae bacterium]
MRRLALIAVGVLGLGGCLTPSIPIPPPDPAEMDFAITLQDGVSTAAFTYPPDDNYKDSTYYVFNHDTGGGVFHVANPDGSIHALAIEATAGNQLVISIEGGAQTVSRCIVLREGAQDPNTYCSF